MYVQKISENIEVKGNYGEKSLFGHFDLIFNVYQITHTMPQINKIVFMF